MSEPGSFRYCVEGWRLEVEAFDRFPKISTIPDIEESDEFDEWINLII